MAKHDDDITKFPKLGQRLLFLDDMKNVNRIVVGVYVVCGLLFIADFFYKKKTYFEVEYFFGFYAIYGFVMCALLVICAKGMRIFLMRDEEYYSPQDVESEDHPEHDLNRESVND